MKYQKTISVILGILLGVGILWCSDAMAADQADFPSIYIDASAGDSGVGSQADPYNELADVNWTTGGDNSIYDYLDGTPSESPTIYLKKGEVWREQMTVGASGTSSYPIVVSAYGTGDDPVISGADAVTSWTNVPGYGDEVMVNGTFDSDNSGWSGSVNGRTITYEAGPIGGVSNVGKLLITADGSSKYIWQTVLEGSTDYIISLKYYAPSTNPGVDGVYIRRSVPYENILLDYDTQDAWHTISETFTTEEGSTSILFVPQDGISSAVLIGDTLYLDDVSLKTVTETNVWQAAVTTQPRLVIINGVAADAEAALVDVDAAGEWYWESNVLYVYDTEEPTDVQASARNNCLVSSSKDYITIDGIGFQGWNGLINEAIEIDTATEFNINDCTFTNGHGTAIHEISVTDSDVTNCTLTAPFQTEYWHQHGIKVYGVDSDTCSGGVISGNVISGFGNMGIVVTTNGTIGDGMDDRISGYTISDNTVFNNGTGVYLFFVDSTTISNNTTYDNTVATVDGVENYGIGIYSSDDNIIEDNIIYGNLLAGIELSSNTGSSSDGNVYNRNKIYDNTSRGLFVSGEATTNTTINNNVIYGNGNEGLRLSGTGVAYNNIIYDNTTYEISISGSNAWTLRNNIAYSAGNSTYAFFNSGTPTATHDHNLYYKSSGDVVSYGGVGYDSSEITDFEATALSEDPLLDTDYSLLAGSPAINAGVDPFVDGDGDQTDYNGDQVWDDTTDAAVGAWADGVEIGAFGFGAYMEDGDLSITASAAGQYCSIATASAPMTQYKWYVVEFDVANIVDTWTLSDVDGGFTIGTISADGTDQQIYFYYNDATGGGFRLTADADTSSGDFDNFSLKEIPAATMYNALGPELVVNGDMELDSNWNDRNTVTTNERSTEQVNNGTYSRKCVTPNQYAGLKSDAFSFTAGNKYLVSFSIYGDGSQITVRTAPTTVVSPFISEVVSAAWNNYSFVAEASSTEATTFDIYLSDAGGGTFYLDDVSIKEIGQFISPSDYINASSIPAEPRFEEDGLAFLGGSVLNLIPYWDFTEWVASNVTVTPTAEVLSPMGANDAYLLLATAGNGTVKYTPVASTDTDYYATLWLKRKTGTGDVDITIDDGTTWTTKTLTTAWQRFGVTKSAANPIVGIRLVTDTDAVYAYGPTLTQTSYFCGVDIPSSGAPTAIAAESLLTANTANLLNVVDIGEGDATSEGTLVTEITFGFSYTDLSGDVALISLNDGTAFLYCDNAGNIEATDGTNTVNVDIDFAAGDTITVALTWSATGDSIRMGILESSSWTWDADSAAYDDDWTNGTNLNIGYGNAFPFHIKDTKFYQRALSTTRIEANF